MTGKDFEELLRSKGYNATEAIAALGCSRPHYYDLLKKDSVPDHWVKAARDLPMKNSTNRKSEVFTMADALRALERAQEEKEKLFRVIQTLSDQLELNEELIKKKFKLTN